MTSQSLFQNRINDTENSAIHMKHFHQGDSEIGTNNPGIEVMVD